MAVSTDLAVVNHGTLDRVEAAPIVITLDQLTLIKRTIAADATDAELELFCYDCRRRGVHPLDKLIHFTKRQGKYTPVTSIDFFRSRAERTHEHMGTSDALFTGDPGDADFAASVTVYRLVQGERCNFTGTARFAEFAPGPPNDFMWKKMPHNQLAKCAEAQALRKGFPQELSGLYTVDEIALDVVADVPPKSVARASTRKAMAPAAVPTPAAPADETPKRTDARRLATVRIFGKDKDQYAVLLDGDAEEYTTRDAAVALDLEQFKGTDHRLVITYVDRQGTNKIWHNLQSFTVDAPPLTAGDIPFEMKP